MATLTDLIQRVRVTVVDIDKLRGQVRSIGDTFQQLGTRMRRTGRRMSMFLTTPIVGIGAAILKVAGDFEAAMNRVEAVSGEAGETLEKLRDVAKELGISTKFSATEAAEGIEMLIKNGLDATQVLEGALDATLNLAAATGSELAPAADVMTDIMVNFKKEGEELGAVVDNIAGTLNKSKLQFDQYTAAAGQAAGVSASLGLSLEDMNAGLAATVHGFDNGGEAGTSFKTFLLKLIPDGDKAAQMMEEFGLSFFDAAGNVKTLGEISETLKTQLGDLSTQEQFDVLKTMFGTRSVRTALALMEQGADGIEKMRVEIAAISAEEQAEARMKGLAGEMVRLRSATMGLALAIADSGMLEAATSLVQWIIDIVRWLAELSPAFLKFITIVALVVAALGPIIWTLGLVFGAIGSVTKGVVWLLPHLAKLIPIIKALTLRTALLNAALLLNPFVLLVAAVALFAFALTNLIIWLTQTEEGAKALADAWDGILNVWDRVVSGFHNTVEALKKEFELWRQDSQMIVDKIVALFDWLWNGIKTALDFIRNEIQLWREDSQMVIDAVKGYWADFADWFSNSWLGTIIATIKSAISWLKSLISTQKEATGSGGGGFAAGGPAMARGGMVWGAGTATSDSIFARLSRGEYVLRAAAVAKYGTRLLDLLNSLQLPRNFFRGLNAGGLVPQIQRFSGGGFVAQKQAATNDSNMVPWNLTIGSETFEGLLMPEHTASQMVKYSVGKQSVSTGSKPWWYR